MRVYFSVSCSVHSLDFLFYFSLSIYKDRHERNSDFLKKFSAVAKHGLKDARVDMQADEYFPVASRQIKIFIDLNIQY